MCATCCYNVSDTKRIGIMIKHKCQRMNVATVKYQRGQICVGYAFLNNDWKSFESISIFQTYFSFIICRRSFYRIFNHIPNNSEHIWQIKA